MSEQSSIEMPSQEVIDFLKERMTLKFPLMQNRRPAKVTVSVQNGSVIVDMWSVTGERIISEEDSVQSIIDLERQVKNPHIRAHMLNSARLMNR